MSAVNLPTLLPVERSQRITLPSEEAEKRVPPTTGWKVVRGGARTKTQDLFLTRVMRATSSIEARVINTSSVPLNALTVDKGRYCGTRDGIEDVDGP